MGRFFSLDVSACNSSLDESASDYLLGTTARFFLKCHGKITPSECIVGQNRLLSFWSPAASLVCHWSVDQFGGCGLLHES